MQIAFFFHAQASDSWLLKSAVGFTLNLSPKIGQGDPALRPRVEVVEHGARRRDGRGISVLVACASHGQTGKVRYESVVAQSGSPPASLSHCDVFGPHAAV